MTPAEIAAAVAQALGLGLPDYDIDCWREVAYYPDPHFSYLYRDGSNVFDAYWFQRCVLWLVERGSLTMWTFPGGQEKSFYTSHDKKTVVLLCPASEFPARAIAELMKDKN